jgi:hypothetical protein
MSKTTLLAACFTIVSLGSGLEPHAARGAEPATDRIAELRARFANDPRVKEASAALAAAEKALEKKLTGDAAIAEARRAEQAARDNVAKAERVAADADPRVQEHRRALEAARARAAELELQRRLEQTRADHQRNETARRPDLQALRTAARFEPHSRAVAESDPRLAAARRKLEEADAALDRKTKELLKDLPEIKAAQRARKDFDDAVAASPAYKAAEAARRAIAEKVAADEKVQAQAGKLKAAGDAQAQHRDQIEVIEKKIRNAAEQAAAKDAGVREAVKAAEVARARVGQTVEDRAAVERKARQAARAVWDEKVKAVIAENPEAKALLKEMQSLEEKLRTLRSQVGELSRLVVQEPSPSRMP